MRNRFAVPPLVAAAAVAGLAAAAPAHAAEPLLSDLAFHSDCGESGTDLGKTFRLGGPLPIDHTGCATTDQQTLRLDTDRLTAL